ncbi:MAG: EAL domain-containing protein [Rhodospirillaceae bacterium]
MYQAKANGKNTLRFFDQTIQTTLEARVTLEAELRQALPLGQLTLYYQPQFDGARNIIGAEALIRWQHPERGLVLPGDFITLAEETGIIIPIGQWVLVTACALLRNWQSRSEYSELTLSVNVSARQFLHPDFVEMVKQVLEETGAAPDKLKLELTESMMLDDVAATIDKMRALRALGVGISMDDFGTGYSSLSYLKQLPLSELKIDKSFVRDIVEESNGAVIVRTIITMARSFGLNVVAEGVETVTQFAILKQYRCRGFQGYFLARPITLTEFEEMVRATCA